MKERFKMYGAIYLFLKKDNKLLFLQRAGSGFMDGYYSLPAGHIEEGETAKQAMIREAKEEINVDFSENDIELKITMNRKTNDRIYIDLFFELKNYTGNINNNEPNKCSELFFCEKNKIPENTVPYIKEALNALENNLNYLECGW